MTLDHHDKLKNLDRLIHRNTEQARKEERSKSRERQRQFRADKAKAKQLHDTYAAAMIAVHGPKFGAKNLKAVLEEMAKWRPDSFIAIVNKFLEENTQIHR